MICVYSRQCEDFTSNGLAVLAPQSCQVTETLNGEWELTLVHPLDARGKWRYLQKGNILRAPVPAAMTPKVQLQAAAASPAAEIYRVYNLRGSLYLRAGKGTKTKYLGSYRTGTEVVVLEKDDGTGWYEVTCPDGKHGYMYSDYLQYVRSEPGVQEAVSNIVESRQLRDQPFRIYRVIPDLGKVTVYARHIFYDLMDNMVQKLEADNTVTGAQAVAALSGACLSAHDFHFYSDLDTTAEEVKIANVNPVEALLGEEGLVEKYGGELVRDWWDVYLVKRVGRDSGVQIRQGKNLLGISYDVDDTNVATRIMPTGENADGEILYLPELYVDSPHLSEYAHPKWTHMEVSEAKEVTDGEDKKTRDECYEAMRTAAQKAFEDGCDQPDVTLKVDFLHCKNTEEYKDFAALQDIFLGDSVRVIAPRIEVAVTMRMTEYVYDCLQKKYTAVTLGTEEADMDSALGSISRDTLQAQKTASAAKSKTNTLAKTVDGVVERVDGIESSVVLKADYNTNRTADLTLISNANESISTLRSEHNTRIAALETKTTDLESSVVLKADYDTNRKADLKLISDAEKSIATLKSEHDGKIAALEAKTTDLESSVVLKADYNTNRTADLTLISNANESISTLRSEHNTRIAALETKTTDLESSVVLKADYDTNRKADLKLISDAEKSIATLKSEHDGKIAALEAKTTDLESSVVLKADYNTNRTADLKLISDAEKSIATLKSEHDGKIAALETKATEQGSQIEAKADSILLKGYVKTENLSASIASLDAINMSGGLSANTVQAQNGEFANMSIANAACGKHTLTIGSKECTFFAPADATFDFADTEEYAAAVSAGKSSVTLSGGAGWYNGSYVVSASNGKTYPVSLPPFGASGGALFDANHKTTVNFTTASVNTPLKSVTVDASSVYKAGYDAGYAAAKKAVKVTAGISQDGFPAQYYAKFRYWGKATIDGEEVGSASGSKSFNVQGAM